ncbi:MAG: hypothetical protein ACXVHS_09685, partial [Methanobacterium sp.]
MKLNNNIIKFSSLKTYLSVHFDYFISVHNSLSMDINSLKNDSESLYNLSVRLFLFSSYFSEISYYLSQIKPFLDLEDIHVKDLTVDQHEILVKFSLF